MKKIIFLLTIICIFSNSALLYSQNRIEYTYDEAGNRIGRRVIVMTPPSQAKSKNNMQDAEIMPYIDVMGETAINIYPNPTRGFLKIDIDNMPEDNQANIGIYDLNGRMLLQKPDVKNSTELDLSNQFPGTYILKISLSGKTSTWKIIKQ
jgi:flagellar basal body-associated protein FliL